MRALNEREKRTIRIGAIALATYLLVFGGLKMWRWLEARRSAYGELELELSRLENERLRMETRQVRLGKLEKQFALDLVAWNPQTIVHEVRAGIDALAKKRKVALPPIRETNGLRQSGEFRKFLVKGSGTTVAVAQFVDELSGIGFPLVVNSFRLDKNGTKPGQVKFDLDVAILDYGSYQAKKPGGTGV